MVKSRNQTVPSAFGQALRKARNDKGFSQENLALESELDRSYISLIESGQKQPTITSVVTLARALQIRPSQLVKNMEDLLEQ